MASKDARRDAYLRASEAALASSSDPLQSPPPPAAPDVNREMLRELRTLREEVQRQRKFSPRRVLLMLFAVPFILICLLFIYFGLRELSKPGVINTIIRGY